MSNYKSLIDEAMKTAQYRLNAGVTKEASVSNDDSLVKEASELANALEYMSMGSANDGSLVGQARAEVIRDFHKAATAQRLGVKLAGDVGESSTMTGGMQYLPPQNGKIKVTAKVDKDGNPLVTSSPDSTGKTMLESYKQANTGTTLYDILMHEKQAGDVGEYDADQYMSITGANENSNRRILDDAYVLSGVTKQEAKAPVRDRLAESFAGTSDTLGDQTMKGMFPAAYQQGGLKKTAMSPIEEYMMEKEAKKPPKRLRKKKEDQAAREAAEEAARIEREAAEKARLEALKPTELPKRTESEIRTDRGKKFMQGRKIVAGPTDGPRVPFTKTRPGTRTNPRKFTGGKIVKPAKGSAARGPMLQSYPTGRTKTVKVNYNTKKSVSTPVKQTVEARPMNVTFPGTRANPKKFKGTISSPTAGKRRGPMIMDYPSTGRTERPRAKVRAVSRPKGVPTFIPGAKLEDIQAKPSPAPAAASTAKPVGKTTKAVPKKTKSVTLGKGSQAAILGTALLGGMAAKQYVHSRKKKALSKRDK